MAPLIKIMPVKFIKGQVGYTSDAIEGIQYVVLDSLGSQDRTAPTVSFDINGELGKNGWHKSDVKLYMNAQDSVSGVNRIEYILNNNQTQIYRGAFNLSEENFSKFSEVSSLSISPSLQGRAKVALRRPSNPSSP